MCLISLYQVVHATYDLLGGRVFMEKTGCKRPSWSYEDGCKYESKIRANDRIT